MSSPSVESKPLKTVPLSRNSPIPILSCSLLSPFPLVGISLADPSRRPLFLFHDISSSLHPPLYATTLADASGRRNTLCSQLP